MKRIEHLLNLEIGLAAESIGTTAIECAVRSRLQAIPLGNLDEYVRLLERNPFERRALVEEVVVSETWFFRDEDVYQSLFNHVISWRQAEPDAVLRVLCVPCATGEEPYSASIALLNAGLKPPLYAIHGVDVSERAVCVARDGIFGRTSFRAPLSPARRAWFEEEAGRHRVRDEARASVTFACGNVLDRFLVPSGSMDIVFCRNLLIYLDRDARTRALDNLHYWLAKDGVVFGGRTEDLETMDSRFVRAGVGDYMFMKRRPAPASERATGAVLRRAGLGFTNVRKLVSQPASPGSRLASLGWTKRPGKPAEKRQLGQGKAPPSGLAGAQLLADAGELGRALAACEAEVRQRGATAEAFCLMGVIRTAQDEVELALDCFSKAVYLDPDHYPALAHLALAHERRGDPKSAQNFRRRAESALAKGRTP